MKIYDILKEENKTKQYREDKTNIIWEVCISADFEHLEMCDIKTKCFISDYFYTGELLSLDFIEIKK